MGGGAYAWYVNEFAEHEKILAKKTEFVSLYDYLETEIAQSPLLGAMDYCIFHTLWVSGVLDGI